MSIANDKTPSAVTDEFHPAHWGHTHDDRVIRESVDPAELLRQLEYAESPS